MGQMLRWTGWAIATAMAACVSPARGSEGAAAMIVVPHTVVSPQTIVVPHAVVLPQTFVVPQAVVVPQTFAVPQIVPHVVPQVGAAVLAVPHVVPQVVVPQITVPHVAVAHAAVLGFGARTQVVVAARGCAATGAARAAVRGVGALRSAHGRWR